jgi:hypothetical protein
LGRAGHRGVRSFHVEEGVQSNIVRTVSRRAEITPSFPRASLLFSATILPRILTSDSLSDIDLIHLKCLTRRHPATVQTESLITIAIARGRAPDVSGTEMTTRIGLGGMIVTGTGGRIGMDMARSVGRGRGIVVGVERGIEV